MYKKILIVVAFILLFSFVFPQEESSGTAIILENDIAKTEIDSTSNTAITLTSDTALSVTEAAIQNTDNSKGVFVLGYHTFIGRKAYTDIAPDVVFQQLKTLKDSGYNYITLNDFFKGNYEGDNNILITVDDGHKSNYKAFYEIFEPLGIRPVYAIPIGVIGNGGYYMTKEELLDLKDKVDFSVHGYTHEYLRKKYFTKKKGLFQKEIFRSKKELEELLGMEINSFTYCYGVYDSFVIDQLRSAGYGYAFNIKDGKIKGVIEEPDYEIKRIMVDKRSIEFAFNYIKTHTKNKIVKQKQLEEIVITSSGAITTTNSAIIETPNNESKMEQSTSSSIFNGMMESSIESRE